MKTKRQLQWLLPLPNQYGDGSAVPKRVIDGLVEVLTSRFGGATIYPAADGIWKNVEEPVTVVQVFTPVEEAIRRFFRAYVKRVQMILKQTMVLAICIEIEALEEWQTIP